MARTKLIAKYAALDTPNLAERIHQTITDHIAEKGIEDLPYLEVNGRWTGKLTISDGGWRGDFDFLYPVLSMCRVDREGNVYADMAKIEKRVAIWRETLHTPNEDDQYLGVCDETFEDGNYMEDDANDLHSAFYKSEMDAFINSDNPDLLEHDRALTEIDNLFRDSSIGADSSQRNFGEGFAVERIENAEDLRKIMEAIEADSAAGGGYSWINPDFDMDNIEEMFAEGDKEQDWMQWIDDLRNGRFGELPEDYDGLAEDEDR
ncbi:MAG: hypothetical protein K2N48_08590 [Muribaculaceae bacterium]|nr:hypothetical protein [Muribaculaceae bacterium]